MPLDTAKLVLVNQMEKARFKLSHLAGRGGDAHSLLPASQQYVILRFANDRVVDGSVRPVRLERLERDGVKEPGGEISRAGDKERLVAIEADAVDFLVVRLDGFLNVTRFGVVQTDLAIVKGHQEFPVESGPVQIGGIDTLAGDFGQINFEDGCVGPGIVVTIALFFVNANFGIVFDKGIANGGKLATRLALGPAHAADGAPVGKLVQALARFHFPQAHRGVRTRGQEARGKSIAVQIPNGPLVAAKGAEALARVGAPDGRHQILARGKKQIAVIIVLNGGNGTLVALQ